MTTPREDAIAVLDVKRLARAMHNGWEGEPCPDPNCPDIDRWRADARNLAREYAALAAEADRGTGNLVLRVRALRYHPSLSGKSADYIAGWDAAVVAVLDSRPLLDLASPDTVDVVARAVHAEDESIESDPPDYDECPDRADHRDYAAALIEVMRQEMER